MADYIFNSSQTITGFNPGTATAPVDTLTILSAQGDASQVDVSESGGNTIFRSLVTGQTVTLVGITRDRLATTNVTFSGGSRLLIGDNNPDASLDGIGNNLNGTTDFNDRLLGLGGNDTIGASLGNDFMNGGAGNDTYTAAATSGTDIFFGGSDDDSADGALNTSAQKLFGGNANGAGLDGNDTLRGGLGNDIIQGNAGNDQLTDGAGVDTINGGQGDDNIGAALALNADGVADKIFGDKGDDIVTLVNGGGSDVVEGGEGNDSITGSNAASLFIQGNAGNDTLTDGAGTTGTVFGGQGNDSISANADANADTFNGNKGADTLVGAANAAGVDTHFGGDDNDSITVGVGAANVGGTYAGDAGADSITMGTGVGGTVNLIGGSGNDAFDIFFDGGGTDTTNITDFGGSNGTDTLAIRAAVNAAGLTVTSTSTTLTAVNGDRLVINTSGAGSANVINGATTSLLAWNLSSTGASVTGGVNADYLVGGSGNDTITTGNGADRVAAGAGNDTVIHNASGTDTLDAGTGADSLTLNTAGTVSNFGSNITGFEFIGITGAGAYTLDLAAATYVAGDVTAATVVTVDGSAATSSLTVTTGADFGAKLSFIGGSAADTVTLTNTTSTATVSGGTGNDSITGGTGNDSLAGGIGDDTIVAAAGADTVNGGAGSDFMTGAAGADIFKFATGDLVASPTSTQVDLLYDHVVATDFIMVQDIAAGGTGWTFTDNTAVSGANPTFANAVTTIGAAAANSSVTLVHLSNASQNLTVNGVTAAQNDAFLVIKDGSGNVEAIFLHSNQSGTTLSTYGQYFTDFA